MLAFGVGYVHIYKLTPTPTTPATQCDSQHRLTTSSCLGDHDSSLEARLHSQLSPLLRCPAEIREPEKNALSLGKEMRGGWWKMTAQSKATVSPRISMVGYALRERG